MNVADWVLLQVRRTMRAIKHALTERYYTWEDAVKVAETDPEINMDGEEGQVYNPSSYEEEYTEPEAWKESEGVAPDAAGEANKAAPKEALR